MQASLEAPGDHLWRDRMAALAHTQLHPGQRLFNGKQLKKDQLYVEVMLKKKKVSQRVQLLLKK